MTARPPEGPKADFDAEGASEAPIPRPPSAKEVDRVSEAQGIPFEYGEDVVKLIVSRCTEAD